jgi:TonB family protein
MTIRTIAIVLTLLSSGTGPMRAQRLAGTGQEPSTLSGTLSDPFGAAAEDTAITLVGLDFPFAVDVRTDGSGRFQFPPTTPGRYVMRAPTSDAIAPSVVTLVPGSRVSLDARLVVEEVAVVFRICRECKPADYQLPDLVKRESGSQRDASTAIVHPAEPEEGWIAFNERPLPYPTAIRTTRLEGTVMIDGTVTPEGTTDSLRVLASTDSRLTELAVPMVQAQRWKAARVRSTPVEAPLHVTVEFSVYGD